MAFEDLIISRAGAFFHGRRFPCVVGRGGVTLDKREGDGATPIGQHRIVGMLYRPDRVHPAALPDWAEPIRIGALWSDDPRDPSYNSQVRIPHNYSHENLRRPDPLYDLVLITDWNHLIVRPGAGSAIFIHRWRRPGVPTAGCIGFAAQDLLWIAARISMGASVVVRG